MYNKELKKTLIENGKAESYRNKRRELFKNNDYDLIQKAPIDDEISTTIFGMWTEEIVECERIRNNLQRQRKKIEDHLNFLSKGNWNLYFLTLTLSEKCIETTSYKTRKTTITRLLSSFCDDFILNVDYGLENEREHYHAIIVVKKKNTNVSQDEDGHIVIEPLENGYKYGFYRAEEIRCGSEDTARLSKYIAKLTMHSLKVKQSFSTNVRLFSSAYVCAFEPLCPYIFI